MIPPHMLTSRGVAVCRAVQQPGEFVVTLPQAQTLPRHFLDTAETLPRHFRDTAETQRELSSRCRHATERTAQLHVEQRRVAPPQAYVLTRDILLSDRLPRWHEMALFTRSPGRRPTTPASRSASTPPRRSTSCSPTGCRTHSPPRRRTARWARRERTLAPRTLPSPLLPNPRRPSGAGDRLGAPPPRRRGSSPLRGGGGAAQGSDTSERVPRHYLETLPRQAALRLRAASAGRTRDGPRAGGSRLKAAWHLVPRVPSSPLPSPPGARRRRDSRARLRALERRARGAAGRASRPAGRRTVVPAPVVACRAGRFGCTSPTAPSTSGAGRLASGAATPATSPSSRSGRTARAAARRRGAAAASSPASATSRSCPRGGHAYLLDSALHW